LRDTGPAKRRHRLFAQRIHAMTKFTMLSGAALLAVAGVALAQNGPGERPDRDAEITRQQVVDRADQAFARLDADRDGRVTPEEARAMGERRRAEMMGRMFDRLDADHDGNITRDEFARAHAMRGGRGGGRHMGPPPGGPGEPEGPGGRGMRGGRMFGEQGFITRDQMRERALARFDRADADHDGTVTVAERRAARERMRERFEERRPN
jgi:Ca2+-binding EF-hand superfamily protein